MANAQALTLEGTGVSRSCVSAMLSLLLQALLHASNPVNGKRFVNLLACLQGWDLQIKWFKSFLNQLLKLLQADGLYRR